MSTCVIEKRFVNMAGFYSKIINVITKELLKNHLVLAFILSPYPKQTALNWLPQYALYLLLL